MCAVLSIMGLSVLDIPFIYGTLVYLFLIKSDKASYCYLHAKMS